MVVVLHITHYCQILVERLSLSLGCKCMLRKSIHCVSLLVVVVVVVVAGSHVLFGDVLPMLGSFSGYGDRERECSNKIRNRSGDDWWRMSGIRVGVSEHFVTSSCIFRTNEIFDLALLICE